MTIEQALSTVYNVPAPADTVWAPIQQHPGVEIESVFPHRIRTLNTTRSGTRWIQRRMCKCNGRIVVVTRQPSIAECHHHLVLLYHYGYNDIKSYVEHINGCKYDNRITNLRWADWIASAAISHPRSRKGIEQIYYVELPPFAVLIENPRLKPNTFYRTPFEFLERCGDESGDRYRVVLESNRSRGYYFKRPDGTQLWVGSKAALNL